MPSFSAASIAKLETCDRRLQTLMYETVRHVDIIVLCGHRTEAEQNRAVQERKSTLVWPLSKHNKMPSLAVDIAPYWPDKPHIRWDNREEFIYVAGLIKGLAVMLDLNIRWGGDWNMNWSTYDERFHDLVHFELL